MIKKDFDAKLQSLNKKINSNETKHLLVKNEIKKKKNFDAAYLRGKNYFDDGDTQNYLVFQPVYKYFKTNSGKLPCGNEKDCLMKKLIFLPDLLIPNLQSLHIIMLG